MGSCNKPGQKPKYGSARVKAANSAYRVGSELYGGRLEAEHEVVLFVLVGIDRVVADRPEHRTAIEQYGGQAYSARDRAPANECAPIEGEAKRDLRPVSVALQKRIDRNKD